MTVPFIRAMGVGVSAIRSDKHSANDSFGLVALCSIGPILAVLILSLIFRPDGGSYTPVVIPEIGDSAALWQLFFVAFPTYFKEIAVSLLPIAAFFAVFNLVSLHLERKQLIRIGVGLAYTYLGLVIFLTGVNVGFMPRATTSAASSRDFPATGSSFPSVCSSATSSSWPSRRSTFSCGRSRS